METNNHKRIVFYDNDGAIDDLISLIMLLNTPNVEIIGVSYIPGNSYLDDGIKANLKILTVSNKNINLSYSKEKGKNPFPNEWNKNTKNAMNLPIFKEIKENENLLIKDLSAPDFIAKQIMKQKEKVYVLLTGPPTNLTNSLKKYPNLKEKIEKVIWMGGTISVEGNNNKKNAEFNCFWDPEASKELFNSGLNIVLFPLDATNQVPFTKDLLNKINNQNNYDASKIVAALANLLPIESHTYYMWDMLATSYLGCENFINFVTKELDIYVDEDREGVINNKTGSNKINVADKINPDKFYEYFLNILRYNFNKN